MLPAEPVLHPVLADLPRLSVGDKFVGIEGDVETKVIVDHHLEGLAFDAIPFVFINGLRLQVALRTVAVAVDAPAGTEFFHKLRRQSFVQLRRDIAQCILQRRSRLRRGKRVATVGCPPDALNEGGIRRQCVIEGYLHNN